MDFPQAPMPAPPGEYAYSWSSGVFLGRIIEESTFTIDRQDRRGLFADLRMLGSSSRQSVQFYEAAAARSAADRVKPPMP